MIIVHSFDDHVKQTAQSTQALSQGQNQQTHLAAYPVSRQHKPTVVRMCSYFKVTAQIVCVPLLITCTEIYEMVIY